MTKVSVILATAMVLGTTALPVSAVSTSSKVSETTPGIAITGDDSGQLVADRRRILTRRGRCRRSWSNRKCAFEQYYARRCRYKYSRRACRRIFRRQWDRVEDRYDDIYVNDRVYDDRIYRGQRRSGLERVGDYIFDRIFD